MLLVFMLYAACFFVFGLIIGSFLNCVIYRLEKEESLWGRSYCFHCSHKLEWYDLFPLLSFAFLSGRCRYCSNKISWQYPLVEILTALVFLLIFFQVPAHGYSVLNILFLLYIASSLIIIFIYDLKHFIIPDKVLFPAIIITFLYQLITNHNLFIINYISAGMGAAIFFLLIFLISSGRWIGFGDVKLAILLGLFLGFPNILVALFLAFLFGAIIGLLLIVFSKKGLKSEVPFAPFLIFGTFLALLFGQEIISWYLNFFTLMPHDF